MTIRLFQFLFLLISTVSFSQSDSAIVCATSGKRPPVENALRISTLPEKLRFNGINSIVQDSTKSTKSKNSNRLIVGLPNTNALYSGYGSLVQIAFKGKKDKLFNIECDGCDTLFRTKNSPKSEWVIRANTPGEIVLRAIDKKGKTLSEAVIPVLPLPFPTVYIDKIDAQAVLTSLPHQIRLIYDDTVPLSVYFLVRNWEISIGNETFKGNGNSTSQGLRDLIQSTKKGILILNVRFADLSGDRQIKEIFEFDLN
jgi:hypothetical protein